VLEENRDEGIAALDPTTAGERAGIAASCATHLATTMTVAVDDLDDGAALAYGGWPDRLYLIGRDGRVAYQGGEGPFGFTPAELEAAIRRELGEAPAAGPPA
jgi:Iodothyronine deiodinase